MTEEFIRYLEMCVNFHHENDESFKITDSAYAKENLMYLKAIHYINELYNDVEGNHTIEQNAGENRIEGGVVSISGSVSEKHTCKECTGETVFKGKKAYCKNRNCDLPACDNFKPKKYRPFNNCDELIELFQTKCASEMGCSTYFPTLYKACVWVKHKEYGTENLIIAFDNDNESIGGSCVFIQDIWVDMKELFDNFTFLDGTPVGKLEEE